MGSTTADHREVHGIDYEVVAIAHVIGELVDLLDRQIKGSITNFANEMMVRLEVTEMNDRGTVAEMDVINRPALGQRLKSAIDSRRINPSTKPVLGSLM